MKPSKWWVVVVLAVAFVAHGACSQWEANDARVRAEAAGDTLAVALAALEASRAQERALARQVAVRDSVLRADSTRWHRERALWRAEASRARRLGMAAYDSSLVHADSATAVFIQAREEQHRAEVGALEEENASLRNENAALWADRQGLVELLMLKDSVIAAQDEALRLSEIRADSWERVANPPLSQRLVGALPEVAVGGLLTLGVLLLVVR